jgi:hypothetical protein
MVERQSKPEYDAFGDVRHQCRVYASCKSPVDAPRAWLAPVKIIPLALSVRIAARHVSQYGLPSGFAAYEHIGEDVVLGEIVPGHAAAFERLPANDGHACVGAHIEGVESHFVVAEDAGTNDS